MTIKYDKKLLYFPHKTVEFLTEIKDVIQFHHIYMVLLKHSIFVSKYKKISNLCAYDINGNELWYADLPTVEPGDGYYLLNQQEINC